MPRNATAKMVATSLEEIERVVRRVVREELKRVTRSLQEPIEPGSPLARDLVEIARRRAQGRIRLRARKEAFERIDRADAIEGIRKGLADVQHGRTRPFREAIEDLRRKYEVRR